MAGQELIGPARTRHRESRETEREERAAVNDGLAKTVREHRLAAAEESRDALSRALERAGLHLLTMRLDPQTSAERSLHPLIDLGRCSPRMARALAVVIERGAAR